MSQAPNHVLGKLVAIVHSLRISWQLFRDRRVPLWTKAVPLLAAGYVIWPADLLADPVLGLGQLDDLAVILLGLRLFMSLCPAALVRQYEQALRARQSPRESSDVVDTTFRVIDEETRSDGHH
ncbi:MAG: DUF1232 domain-containing protein [Chloroflexota bacterium]